MRQFAIIGLGSFGVRVLEKLAGMTDQILIVDRDRDIVEKYKDLASKSYITDALDRKAIERIIPENIDVAIVDVGDHIEPAILVTNALKQHGARQIIARADTEERGQILEMVGATRVVYPALEAANKIVPMLVSSSLFSFMSISPTLVLAELRTPEKYEGMTLLEANLRQAKGINVVAVRKEDSDEYRYFEPGYRLTPDDVLLCAGTEDDVTAFTGTRVITHKTSISEMLKGMLGRVTHRGTDEVRPPVVGEKDVGRNPVIREPGESRSSAGTYAPPDSGKASPASRKTGKERLR